MSSAFAHSDYMPCSECGVSVPFAERHSHVCDPQLQLEFQFLQLSDEVIAFEDELRDYLESPHGQFAQWLAERDRP